MKITLFPSGEVFFYKDGTSLLEISRDFQDKFPLTIVAARVNNMLRELTYIPEGDVELEFVDLTSEDGERIYVRSLSCVFIRAAREIIKGCRVSIEHSLGNGIYCEIHGDRSITESDVLAIEKRMREIIQKDIPFIKESIPLEEAVEMFEKDGQLDKVRLLKYRKRPFINIYSCGWFKDYFYGYMVPSTGFLKKFGLKFYPPGLILQFPNRYSPDDIPPYIDQPKLAAVFKEAEQWGEILGVADVGSLNERISMGRGRELVRIAEALHEKKIAQIADEIAQHSDRLRVILIAGPSSSGKTTFAQRLSVQLKVNGLRPVSVSLDDYFVNRDMTPRDENGNYDFESIEAIDIALFNRQLVELIEGKKVEVPTYNFQKGVREYRGNMLQVEKNQPIIIEGIHGLNERLTSSIPKENKFKIYVSALTQLNIDDHNRIPTTDTRILRRIVRDSQFRSNDALNTIKMWPSVRRGEEKYIFPFQEDANVMFNSALIYELSVLKRYAEPLLQKIDSRYREFPKARILLKFLDYFLPFDEEDEIPPNSIIREFIGKSCFYKS
ncbi:Threonine--tRNA ligase 2 [Koleobacter methoxysyntrophicus]|uniref:Threonine--tRNA ligase 2 n=1 Tax=Koleobacter methoxysyntrophicus TaxID=2751313 RepID=A0A8A0RJS0_9FIRM|nr:nucleoside kinase [Koleobacter methoxysyntrophicus]QSQ07767.1 Threonine--tRNA ligase 2 [Koleobacter methoxysyntrophicus]